MCNTSTANITRDIKRISRHIDIIVDKDNVKIPMYDVRELKRKGFSTLLSYNNKVYFSPDSVKYLISKCKNVDIKIAEKIYKIYKEFIVELDGSEFKYRSLSHDDNVTFRQQLVYRRTADILKGIIEDCKVVIRKLEKIL